MTLSRLLNEGRNKINYKELVSIKLEEAMQKREHPRERKCARVCVRD